MDFNLPTIVGSQLVLGCWPEAQHSTQLLGLSPRPFSVCDGETEMAENGLATQESHNGTKMIDISHQF